MKEDDYIRVTDLRSVLIAELVLRDISPANNTLVPQDEYRTVMRILSEWRITMFAKMQEEDDEDET